MHDFILRYDEDTEMQFVQPLSSQPIVATHSSPLVCKYDNHGELTSQSLNLKASVVLIPRCTHRGRSSFCIWTILFWLEHLSSVLMDTQFLGDQRLPVIGISCKTGMRSSDVRGTTNTKPSQTSSGCELDKALLYTNHLACQASLSKEPSA